MVHIKKLTLEQVFYMPMMMSRLRFLVDDFAFRFKPSDTNLSVPNLKNMDQVAFKIVAILIIRAIKGQNVAT